MTGLKRLSIVLVMLAELAAATDPAAAGEDADATGPGWLCSLVPDACACPASHLESPLLRVPVLDDAIDGFRSFRDDSSLKVAVGMWSWWNYNRDSHRFTYGFETIDIPGTYFYYTRIDWESPPGDWITFGAHVEARFRENAPIRPFISKKTWFQEAYGYLKTPDMGTLKFGKIVQHFGKFWNGSFWGSTAYFNGLKLNSEWGFSFENSWNWTRLSVPFSIQGFLGEDEINGSLPGGDGESSAIFDHEQTAVFRVSPTYRLDKNTDITLGLSALVGKVSNSAGSDDTRKAFAIDMEIRWCTLKIYGEYAVHDGAVHEAHYVTGGPSDNKEFLDIGVSYTYGPLTARASFSRADYENPDGHEEFYVIGLDARLTSWLLLQLEYVDWTAKPAGVPEIQFERGVQIVLNLEF